MNEVRNKGSSVVYLELGDEFEIVKSKGTPKKKPNYYRVGNGTMNKHKIKSIDLLREMAQMTKAAQFLVLAIKDGMTYENGYEPVVRIVKSDLSLTYQKYLKQGYKELREKNLVHRVKRSHYMLNPDALIPPDYEKAKKLWDEIDLREQEKEQNEGTPSS